MDWVPWGIWELIKGQEQLSHEERQTELGLFGLEKRKLRGNLFIGYKYLMGWYEEGRTSSQIPTGWEAMGTHSSTGNSIWNKKTLLYCKVGQTLAQVSQRRCGVSVCGDTQKPWGHGLGGNVVADPALRRMAGDRQMISRDPTSTIMCFCSLISKFLCTWTALYQESKSIPAHITGNRQWY